MGSARENDGRKIDHQAPETPGESHSSSSSSSPFSCLGVRAYPFGAVEGLELHPMYRHIREHEPLCRVRLPYGGDAWLVTRYDDFKTVLGDARFGRAAPPTHDQPRVTPTVIPLGLVDMDPPAHTRLRGWVSKAFTARQMERLRPRVEQIVDDLVTAMLEAGPPAELMRSLALPLTITVICELLGVPPADRSRFQAWVAQAPSTALPTEPRIRESIAHLRAYTSGLVAQRRREPADDLLDTLIQANEAAGLLSDEELVFFAVTLLGAGYETTKNEIGNFVYLLLTHPDQWALLCQHPELIKGAIEELLRFTPLATDFTLPRYAKVDIQLGAGTVRAGDPVFAFPPAANRDPRAFPDPDRLDVTRPVTPHAAFGYGAHHCAGAPLARMELQVALAALLARVPGLRLAVDADEITWDVGGVARGPMTLPVRW